MPSNEFFARKKEQLSAARQKLSEIENRAFEKVAPRLAYSTAGLLAIALAASAGIDARPQDGYILAQEPHGAISAPAVEPVPLIESVAPVITIPPRVQAPSRAQETSSPEPIAASPPPVSESSAALKALSNEPMVRAEFPVMTEEDLAAINDYIQGTLRPALEHDGLTIVEPINEDAGKVNQINNFIVTEGDKYGSYGTQFVIIKVDSTTYHLSPTVWGSLEWLSNGEFYEEASRDGRLGHLDPGAEDEAYNFSPNNPDSETDSVAVQFVREENKDKSQRMAEHDRMRAQKESEQAA